MQHESRETSDVGERAGTSEAERRERLARLVLTLAEAAAVLDMPEGTLKSRLLAAKRALLAAAEPLLPASQRGAW